MAPHSIFGWSYPPGCSGPPDDYFPDSSPLIEEILGVLEDGGVPTEINDKIVMMIEAWEREQEMEIKTPESIKPYADQYHEGAWRSYTVYELGMWIHLLLKRAAHRTDRAKANKDVRDAQNYLDMIQAHVGAGVPM